MTLRLTRTIGFLPLLVSSSVFAQSTLYDKDCNGAKANADVSMQIDVCRSHLACDIAYRAGAAGCSAKNFLSNVTRIFADKGTIDPDDVVEAAKPAEAATITPQMRKHEEQIAADRLRFRAEEEQRRRSRSNPADEAVGKWSPGIEIIQPTRTGGYIGLFQETGQASSADATGTQARQGIRIGEDAIARGTFRNGKLEGQGEQILANGTYRGGAYSGGRLSGQGFEFGEEGGKVFVKEGTFRADRPDGQITVAYEGGNMRRQLWQNGAMVSESPLPAVAQTSPLDPNGNWKGDRFATPDSSRANIDVVTLGGKTYLVGALADHGKRDGFMKRIFADGTVQFEEWENGRLMQVGLRGTYAATIAPQIRAKPGATPQVAVAPRPPASMPASLRGMVFGRQYFWNCPGETTSRITAVSSTELTLGSIGDPQDRDMALTLQPDGSFMYVHPRAGDHVYIRFRSDDLLDVQSTRRDGEISANAFNCKRVAP